MTEYEYNEEIDSIAQSLCEEALADNDNDEAKALDDIWDCRLHETIDGHQWVIYCSYNLDVIQHSRNDDYYADNFGCECLKHSLSEGGLSGLHTAIAFWAMYADVSDRIEQAMNEAVEGVEA